MPLETTGRLILASASPRRRELLSQLGLAFDVRPPRLDETPLSGEAPEEYVLRLAEAKARAVSAEAPAAWVLAADTIVTVSGRILGKPGSCAEAVEMLETLSGREHEVFTGFCISRKDREILVREAVGSVVLFKEIAPDERDWYAASPEPYDKAGGYAVQGSGGFLVREIRGSCSNVVGLPLCEVVAALKALGTIRFTGVSDGHRR